MRSRIILATDPQAKKTQGHPVMQVKVHKDLELAGLQLRVLATATSRVAAALQAEILARAEAEILPFMLPRDWRDFYDNLSVLVGPEGGDKERALLRIVIRPNMVLFGEQLLRIADDVLLRMGRPVVVVCAVGWSDTERDAVVQLLLRTLWLNGLVVRAVMRPVRFETTPIPSASPLWAVVARQ